MAVDSEHNGSGEWNKRFIKDRLFLGYQEKADAIEVISYNEGQGKFDFQVVSNYAQGEIPSVSTIEDGRCISCHQNRGPIFSRSNWDETEFNDKIFRRIAKAKFGPGYESSRSMGSGAAAVDLATNRANMFSLFQTFWQQACRSSDKASAIRCRAGLFQMAVEHRLQETNRTLIPPRLFSEYLVPVSNQNTAMLWPDGISFPSSDITNQNPVLMGERPHLNSAEELKKPRPFLIKWNPENILRIVEGIGDFLPLTDIRRLDQVLFDIPKQTASSHINFRGSCRMKRVDEIKKTDDENKRSGDISVRCHLTEGALSSGVGFYGNFHIDTGTVKSNLPLSSMYLDSSNFIVGLSHRGGNIQDTKGKSFIKLSLLGAKQQLHARLPTGAILDSIEISWNPGRFKDHLFAGNQVVTGKAKLTALADTGLLDTAIERLVEKADRNDLDLFAAKPFRGKKIVEVLIAEFSQVKN